MLGAIIDGGGGVRAGISVPNILMATPAQVQFGIFICVEDMPTDAPVVEMLSYSTTTWNAILYLLYCM